MCQYHGMLPCFTTPLRNKLDFRTFINHSSWYLIHSMYCKTGEQPWYCRDNDKILLKWKAGCVQLAMSYQATVGAGSAWIWTSNVIDDPSSTTWSSGTWRNSGGFILSRDIWPADTRRSGMGDMREPGLMVNWKGKRCCKSWNDACSSVGREQGPWSIGHGFESRCR